MKSPEGFLEDLAALRGPDPDRVPLHVLLYLRDPVDHAVSHYQQSVKRGNYTGTLADSLGLYRLPAQTLRVLEVLRGAGAEVTILNYSRHRARLLPTLENWLGLAPGTLEIPPVAQVNRSPTRAELELQRLVNASEARQSWRVVSDPLCNQLPEIRSEQPALSSGALAAFLDQMAAVIGSDAYAAAVPEAERPRVGTLADYAGRFPDPDAQDEAVYSFTAAQLQVLAGAIGAEMKRSDHLRDRLEKARRQIHRQKKTAG